MVDLDHDALRVHAGDLPIDPARRDDLVSHLDALKHLRVALPLLALRADQHEVHEAEHHEQDEEERIHAETS